MASIAHLAAGAACGAIYARKTGSRPVRTMAAFSAVALAPDLDLIGLTFRSGGTPLEHRVMTHSLPFAAAVGAVAAAYAWRRPQAIALGVLVALALASHGIIDAMTSVGHAPRMMWPFTWERIAMPWQPFPGVESFHGYFSFGAVGVFAQEAFWSLPFAAIVAGSLWAPRRGGEEPDRPSLTRSPDRAGSAA